ncbi:MAG: TRAP transporter large permease [Desulfobacteraceae bacterium]|jgi:C4-dicarboxylate transporter DctM subunit|nr:TRAP transporter large permease [Desulfobacteraceae bacterium]
MATVLFVTFILLLIIQMPVAFSLAVASLIALLWKGFPLVLVIQRMVSAADSFILLAVPLFMLAGNLMVRSGIAQAIVDFADSLVGFIRGGMAQVNILTSMFFGGISGAAVADTSAVGSVLIPPMLKRGYDKGLTTSVTAASSTLGVIIPPSIPMIIFGVVTGASVGRLFLAGVIPGILVGLTLMVVTDILSRRLGYVATGRIKLKQLLINFYRSFLALMMPVIIIGGIMFGIVTPTEAAVLAVLYAFVVGVFITRTIKLRHLPEIFTNSAITTGVVMLMITAASLYGLILTQEQIPLKAAEFISQVTDNPVLVLFMMTVLYFAAGMILDLGANIIILVPVLYPTIKMLQIDPVHFGIVTVISLAMGLITPPVGVCLFVACGISKMSILKASKAILPYLMAIVVIIILIILVPDVALWLPNLIK